MRFILINFSLFLIYFKLTSSDCVFDRFATDFQPLFFQKFGYEKLFIPVRNSRITIPEAGSVEVYCPYGYRKLNNDLKDGKKVKIKCIHNTYSLTYDDELYSLDEDEKFQCKKPTTVLQSIKTYTCGDSDAFILSFEYDSINIALAEICYDFSSLKFQYVYYVSAKRTTALSALSKLSVVDNTTFNNPIDSVSNSLYVPPDEIKIQTKLLMGSLAGAVEYIFKPIVPLDVFNPFVTDSLEVSNTLTHILWWKPLREGNWKIYQRTLKSFTDKNAYDIIAGVSGIAPAYNSNFRNKKEIKIEVNGLTQDAPKFIWNYLIPRNKNVSRDYRQEFVVIGYNSPFIDGNFTNDLNRYSDVCGDIGWLEPLNDFRKQYTLGYIFCLQPVVARFFLDGFPSADAVSYRGRVTKATNISPSEPPQKQNNSTCTLNN